MNMVRKILLMILSIKVVLSCKGSENTKNGGRKGDKTAEAQYRFLLQYGESSEELKTVAEDLQSDSTFRNVVEVYNRNLKLPRNVKITFENCTQTRPERSAVNAYYLQSESAIVMCYEMAQAFVSATEAAVESGQITKTKKQIRQDMVSGMVFIMLHELGHALVGEFGLPATGNQESVADQFATLTLTFLYGTSCESLFVGFNLLDSGITTMFRLTNQSSNEVNAKDLFDEHPHTQERATEMTCLYYGANPSDLNVLVGSAYLSERRAPNCATETSRVRNVFEELLGDSLKVSIPPLQKLNCDDTTSLRLLQGHSSSQ